MKVGYLAAALLAVWLGDRLAFDGRYTAATVASAASVAGMDWSWSS
jgi:energy-converting hydrogenase Eha subunit B